MSNYKFTIFTASFNRGHTLNRLYNSLCNQSIKDFEWIIVDDGSTDDTEELVNSYKNCRENSIAIKYLKQERGGKHRAINLGLSVAEGELFFLVDSDDYLTLDALEKILFWENKIENKSEFSGLCGISGYDNNTPIGNTFVGRFKDMKVTDQFGAGISGDRANIFYTKVFKNYNYPTFEGEWHIAPGVPYIRMAQDGYKMRYFNDIIYIAEYLEDGLTSMGDRKILENFRGYTLRTKELLQSDISYSRKIQVLGKYAHLAKKEKKMNYVDISKEIDSNIFLSILLGIIAGYYMKLK